MLVIASDHGGFDLKQQLCAHLRERGIDFEDIGCFSEESTDYPVWAEKAGRAIADGTFERGVLVCGTGIGMSIAANKIPGIRAALCGDCYSAAMAREHNDANILCLGARTLGSALALRILDTWLDTPFSCAEKHARRIAQLGALDR